MSDILGLEADVTTALIVIVTGVVIPAVTALLSRPNLPSNAKRWIPVGLAFLAAIFIVLLRAGGPFAEQAMTVILLLATLTGIAQALYALMPATWKAIESSTAPTGKRADRDGVADGRDTPSSM